MSNDDRRDADRQPVSMRIKLKYPDVQSFIERYSSNISRGGIFVQTERPVPVGARHGRGGGAGGDGGEVHAARPAEPRPDRAGAELPGAARGGRRVRGRA